ncbi:MAG: RluA family pseudouridine synthase, partial [Mycobacteriales bacterium]
MAEPAGVRRSLPVPAGLDGLRLDAALARLFGLSRTAAAQIARDGLATVDGAVSAKSDRVVAGAWLEVELPAPAAAPTHAPVPVPGLSVVYEDDDVVVVDKPVGVAAHPSPGWDGPTVVGGILAAGARGVNPGWAKLQSVVPPL